MRNTKVEELVSRHGVLFQELWHSGRIPRKQLDNFYGRAAPRQRAILEAMDMGSSYSRAYELSDGEFDTRCWSKVGNRASAARGHLLLAAVRMARSRSPVSLSEPGMETLHGMAQRLADDAVELSRRLLSYDLQETPIRTRGRDSRLTDEDISSRGVVRFQDLQRELSTAITKLAKTTRDLPQMQEQLGEMPTVRLAATTLMEVGRIVRGVRLFDAVLATPAAVTALDGRHGDVDPWGIGGRYAWAFPGISPLRRQSRRIATHRDPDADALVSAWIAERFLFSAEVCEVEFVGRAFNASDSTYDCVVDVGRHFDPVRRVFDHKPPACADRNQTCAAKMIWAHVRDRTCSVGHLDDLIELIHDGDAATRRSRSQRFARSYRTGLHALIRHARTCCENDQMRYQAVKLFLDGLADAS